MTGAGLLERTVEGRQVYFQANRRSPIFPELQALLTKTAGPVEVVRRALEPLADRILVALIFGSAARGELRNDSDVDLLIVGDTPFATVVEALGTAQERLGREINPTVYPLLEFRTKLLEGHHFLTRVLREPYLFVLGGADELDRLGEERLAQLPCSDAISSIPQPLLRPPNRLVDLLDREILSTSSCRVERPAVHRERLGAQVGQRLVAAPGRALVA